MPGFPDWQAIVSWLGSPIVALQNQANPAALQSLGPFNVNTYSYLNVFAQIGIGAGRVSVNFPLPSPLTAQPGTLMYGRAGTLVWTTIPVMAPTCKVFYGSDGTGGAIISLCVTPTNVPVTIPPTGTAWTLITNTSGVIAPAGNFVTNLFGYFGRARLVIEGSAGVHDAKIVGTTDTLVNLGTSFAVSAGIQKATYEVWLPPQVNTLTVTNTAAVNQTFTITLTASLDSTQ